MSLGHLGSVGIAEKGLKIYPDSKLTGICANDLITAGEIQLSRLKNLKLNLRF